MSLERVLIIDDSPEDRDAARYALQTSFAVFEAASGKTGLQTFAELHPDCVVLDYSLPDMDGLDVLRSMTAAEFNCPVVMLTSTKDPQVGATAIKCGALDFSAKSFLDQSLNRMVRNAIDRAALLRDRQRISAENVQLAALVKACPDALLTVSTDRKIRTWNPGAENLYGRPADAMVGCAVDALWPDNLNPDHEALFTNAEKKGFSEIETEHLRTDGSHLTVCLAVTPIRDDVGLTTAYALIAKDLTTRKQAETAVRESEARFRLATDAGHIGTFEWNITTNEVTWSESMARNAGFEPGTFAGTYEAFRNLVHPEDLSRVGEKLAEALQGLGDYEIEFRMMKPDGSIRWALARGIVLRDREGRPERLIGIDADVTEHKLADQHKSMMLHELNHRVKNTLAIVQALAMMTFRNSEDTSKSLNAFSDRIVALAKANDILTQENWETAELGQLVRRATEPYTEDGENQFVITGPELRLSPSRALALTLVLHELCTNAVKYGALSTPVGRVSIQWVVLDKSSPRGLAPWRLNWVETGGPCVTAPTRHGFGSDLIQRLLKGELQATVAVEYLPDGVACTIEAPRSTDDRLPS